MSEKSKSESLPSSWADMLEEAQTSQLQSKPVEGELVSGNPGIVVVDMVVLGEQARNQIAGTLDAEGVERPESRDDLIERIRIAPKYEEFIDTLKHYGFLTEGNATPPSLETVISSFTDEQLELAGRLKRATLLIIPNNSFSAKVKAMNEHKLGLHTDDLEVNTEYTNSDSGSEQITGWRVVMVEGKPEADTCESGDMYLKLNQRIKNRKASMKPGEKGIDRDVYIALMMNSLKRGKPVDTAQFTILDNDPILSESEMPFGGFDIVHKRPDFLKCATDGHDDFIIFRSCVEADLKTA